MSVTTVPFPAILPLAAVLGISVLGPAAPVSAQGMSPADRWYYEGSTSTSYPLGRFNARVQQLHGDLPTHAVNLAGHAYRRDAGLVRGTVLSFDVEMEVSLSMSPRAAGDPSRTFAENRGPDPVVVLPRTVVSFPETVRPDTAPAPETELVIPYLRPFPLPEGGGTLCLETVVYGNLAPTGGADRNFQPYLDAHELFRDGRSVQPGYRFGEGCTAPGGSGPGYANFELIRRESGMELEVRARNGVPDDGSGLAWSYLMVSATPFSGPLPVRPDCLQGTAIGIFTTLGPNDASGSWDGSITDIQILPTGQTWYLQVGSADLGTGAVALADVTSMVIPPPGPAVVPASRIAAGSDRNALTGSISFAVPVTLFF